MPYEIPTCASVTEKIASVAGDDLALDGAAAQHVASCLRCQAEQVQYRRLMKAMRDLRDAPVLVDPKLEHEVIFAIDRHDRRIRHVVSTRVAATVGGVAAGAAAAAGVIALTVRQRRIGHLAS
jgi:hypothetical protein